MSKNKPKTLYAIQCTENKKIYVGCCTNLESRIYQHFRELANNNKTMRFSKFNRGNTPWQDDYNKYGKDAFKVYVIKRNVSATEAKREEFFYIEKYKSNDPDFGYNIRPTITREVEFIEGEPELFYENKKDNRKIG